MDTPRTPVGKHGRFEPDRLEVGKRVMVRRRLTEGEISDLAGTLDERATLTDAIGDLEAKSATTLTILTKDGLEVIAFDDIVAAKQLPPKPARRARRTMPSES